MLDPILTIVTDLVRDAAQPLTGSPADYDELLEFIGDAHVVLLGEASHGTHEFYRERAQVTKRLIREKGFTTIAVEADWPDAYRVNGYVQGQNVDADAVEALGGFRRFPAWMWRNADHDRREGKEIRTNAWGGICRLVTALGWALVTANGSRIKVIRRGRVEAMRTPES
jgi:hypothetical protein